MKNKFILITSFLVLLSSYSFARITETEIGKTYEKMTLSSVSTNSTNNSDSIDVSKFFAGSVQAVWADQTTGGVTKTATFELRSSCDGVNYDSIPNSSTTTSGVSGSEIIELTSIPCSLLRISITGTNASSGTITPYFIGKKY